MPSVTLAILDTDNHNLAKFAVDQCVSKFDFDNVVVFSDKDFPGYPLVTINKITDIEQYQYFMLKDLINFIETDFVLCIQFDGFILNSDCWNPLFFDYDYIGAPWARSDHGCKNVGNGGFSLRSRKLLEFVANKLERYNHIGINEDVVICKTLAPDIIKSNLHFAPDTIASHFSYETYRYRYKTFGYHGSYLMPEVFNNLGLLEYLLDNLSIRVLKKYEQVLLREFSSYGHEYGQKFLERIQNES